MNCKTCVNPIEYRVRRGWVHTDWDGDTPHDAVPERTVTYSCGGTTGHSQACVLSECVHLAVLERRAFDGGHKCWSPDCIHPNCDKLNHVDLYGKFFRKEWAPYEVDGFTFIPMTAKFGRVKDAKSFTEKHLVSGHSYEANVVRAGAVVMWLAVVPNEHAVPGYEGYVWSMTEAAGAYGTYGGRVAYVNGQAGPHEY